MRSGRALLSRPLDVVLRSPHAVAEWLQERAYGRRPYYWSVPGQCWCNPHTVARCREENLAYVCSGGSMEFVLNWTISDLCLCVVAVTPEKCVHDCPGTSQIIGLRETAARVPVADSGTVAFVGDGSNRPAIGGGCAAGRRPYRREVPPAHRRAAGAAISRRRAGVGRATARARQRDLPRRPAQPLPGGGRSVGPRGQAVDWLPSGAVFTADPYPRVRYPIV